MRLCIIIALVALCLSCGSDEVPVERNNANSNSNLDAGSSDSGNEFTEAIRAINTGVCEKAFECCSVTQAIAVSGTSSAEECGTGSLQPYSPLTPQALSDALNRGSVEVFQAQVSACRQEIAALSCEAWTTTNPFENITACSDFVAAQLNDNDPCTFDFECRSATCVDTGAGGRVCATLVAIEESCDPAAGVFCEEGSSCDTFGASRCVETQEEGSSCISDDECTTGLCDVGPAGTNVCVAPPPICEAPA